MGFGLAAQLCQRDNGNAQFLSEHFHAAAYLADLDCTVLESGTIGCGRDELEIVDYNQPALGSSHHAGSGCTDIPYCHTRLVLDLDAVAGDVAAGRRNRVP